MWWWGMLLLTNTKQSSYCTLFSRLLYHILQSAQLGIYSLLFCKTDFVSVITVWQIYKLSGKYKYALPLDHVYGNSNMEHFKLTPLVNVVQ